MPVPARAVEEVVTREGSAMPRFAANISTMFTERPFAERIQAAADAGFRAVECQFPYEVEASELEARLDRAGVDMVLLNTPAGDFIRRTPRVCGK